MHNHSSRDDELSEEDIMELEELDEKSNVSEVALMRRDCKSHAALA